MDYINQQILNYKITRLLGEGGMASVYEAVHPTLNKRVAVKILNPILMANKQIRERFVNEARIMVSLEHPNIVRVDNFEERENMLAIVMEMLEGVSLHTYIQQKGSLEPDEAKRIMLPVLSALSYAHKQDVVHRDIKPSNIFIQTDGTPKILDFGIAKLVSGVGNQTRTGVQMGTLAYMSPEQIKDSKHIDYRTDIYSLAVSFYYMLTGKKAYDTTTLSDFDIRKAIVEQAFPKLKRNIQYQEIINKATDKDPNERFQTCEEFAHAIKTNDDTVFDPYNEEGTNNGNPKPPFPDNRKKTPPKKTEKPETAPKPSNKKLLIGISAGIVAMLLLLLFMFMPTEERRWQRAKKTNTISAYKQYIIDYPDSKYKEQAKDSIVNLRWQKVKKADTEYAYNQYIVDNPDSKYKDQAKHEIEWLRTKKNNTNKAYNDYLNKYKKGVHRKDAKSRIADKNYDSKISKKTTLPALRKYLAGDESKMLSKDYKAKANKLLNNLVADSTALQAYKICSQVSSNNYINNCISDFNKYIKQYPKYATKARNAIKILKNFSPPQMVYIPGGTFQMGDGNYNAQVHTVTLESFSIGQYEVTFREYDAFCDVTGRSKPSSYGWGRGNRPVINVSWYDAVAYCKWLSKMTGKTYRLPTEAEWEYAASSGSTHQSYAGTNDENSLGSYAWYSSNSGSKTHPVGRKSPNKFGLYDMSGNVWEWCNDWYGGNYYGSSPRRNPQGPSGGSFRVFRGGSWHFSASYCRVADRSRSTPTDRGYDLGFRVARR